MTQSRNAVSNLVARYKAVLKNCHLLNVMAAAALVGAVVLGSAGMAVADTDIPVDAPIDAPVDTAPTKATITETAHTTGDLTAVQFTQGGELESISAFDYKDATGVVATDISTGTQNKFSITGANKTVTMSGTFTLNQATTIKGGGTLAVNGNLTQTASGSNISDIDVVITHGKVATEDGEDTTQGLLVLGNDLTVGNVTFNKNADLVLFGNTETVVNSAEHGDVDGKILKIADGKTLTFVGDNDIRTSSPIADATTSVLLTGEGDIASAGTLTVKANPVLMTTMKAENIDIVAGGDLTIGQNDTYNIDSKPAPKAPGTLTAKTINNNGEMHVDFGSATVGTITNNGKIGVDGDKDNTADGSELFVGTLNNVTGTVSVGDWDDSSLDGYDAILVVDKLVNTGTVEINNGGKILFKNGFVASADEGTYVFDGGEAIVLGKGLDLSKKTSIDAEANTSFSLGNNEKSKITTTKVTLEDGVKDIHFHGGKVLILGDGADGKFINNSGNLTIGDDDMSTPYSELFLGSSFTSEGAQKYTPEYANYNQGGTYAGTVTVAAHAEFYVDGGNWNVGNVASKSNVYVGSDGVEASLTTGDFTQTAGTVTVADKGTLTATSVNIATGSMTVAGDLAITGTQNYVAAVTEDSDKGIEAADPINASLTIANANSLTINDGGSLKISDKVLEVAVKDGDTAADVEVATALQGKVTLEADSTLIIDGSGYTSDNLKDIAKSLDSDDTIGLVSSTGIIAFNAETELTNGSVNADMANGLNLTTQSGAASKIAATNGTIAAATAGETFTSTAAGLVSNEDDGKLTIGGAGTTEITLKSASGNTIAAADGGKAALNLDGTGSTTLNLEGLADLATLTASSGASINVGSTAAAGVLKASDVKLSGAKIFLDPAWEDGVAIEGASKAGLEFAAVSDADASGNVDGLITVGQNSLVVLGSTDTNAAETIFNSFENKTWGATGITAATFIMKDQTIASTGGLLVDGSLTSTSTLPTVTPNTATFKTGSALVVNASGISATGAALTDGTIKAESGAVLLISATGIETETVSGKEQATVKVTDSQVSITGSAWGSTVAAQASGNAIDYATIADNSVMMEITGISNDSTDGYVVTLTKKDAATVFTDMDADLAEHLNGYSNAGNSFLDKAFAMNDPKAASVAIEGAAKAGHAAGIGAGLQNVQAAGGANIEARQDSFAFNGNDTSNMLAMNGDGAIVPVADKQEGLGIWFMPMYKHSSADGFDSGSYDYGFDTDLYGATLGADYTFASSLRLGLAFNVGTGESDSTGDFSGTENDFDYVGLTAYAGMNFGNLGLYADFGYTASSNDITQNNDLGRLSADSDADLLSAGIKADYKIAMNNINLTPYAGIRLNYYSIDGYNTKFYGENIIDTDSSDYTIIEFPVGLTIDTTLNSGDWAITPSAGLGIKFAAGDLDHDQRVSFNGLAGSSTVSSEVADEVTFQGALGLGFAKDAYSIDLGYTLDLSENVESHGVNVNLRYEF